MSGQQQADDCISTSLSSVRVLCRWGQRLRMAKALLHAARDALSGSASSGTSPVPLTTSNRC